MSKKVIYSLFFLRGRIRRRIRVIMKFPIEIFKEGDGKYIATCPRLEIYSYGDNIETTINRMKEIVKFYIESAEELGISLEEVCGVSDEIYLQIEGYHVLDNNNIHTRDKHTKH
jgi:predicted RNase H-like HicB family nuclease